MCPTPKREEAWRRLGDELDLAKLGDMAFEVPLDAVVETVPKFLEGRIRGRVVVPIAPEL